MLLVHVREAYFRAIDWPKRGKGVDPSDCHYTPNYHRLCVLNDN